MTKGGGGGEGGATVFFMWRPKIYPPSPTQRGQNSMFKIFLDSSSMEQKSVSTWQFPVNNGK